MGIYAVKTTMDETEPNEVATVTAEKKQILKNLYWEMNTVSTRTETVEETYPDDAEAEPSRKLYMYIALIRIDCYGRLTAQELESIRIVFRIT